MSSRYINAIVQVAAQISAGRVLKAHNAVDHEDTTVGPYREAVNTGARFAVVGWRGKRPQIETSASFDAARLFVDRVGEGRALAAART